MRLRWPHGLQDNLVAINGPNWSGYGMASTGLQMNISLLDRFSCSLVTAMKLKMSKIYFHYDIV
jgi:hypothetical protein